MQLSKYLSYNQPSQEIQDWINIQLKAYLKKNEENQQEIEHIIDFLKSSQAPKRLRKMSYVQAKVSAVKWVSSLMKKGNTIKEVSDDVEVILDFNDGFKLVQLVGENAFKREGSLMRHCVASYYGKDDCKVYSLRDENNKPHCTLEVYGDDIQQIKGKGNGSIHPKYIEYIVKTLEKFGMDVRSSELENLGYFSLSDELNDIITTKFDGAKYYTFNEKSYFYKYSTLVQRS